MSNISYSTADKAFAPNTVNPVLAKLYLSHGIRAEAMNDLPSEDRAGLCDDIVNLIEMAERQTDREMATDILISLLSHAEKHLKQAVSERLSLSDRAPLRLILQFINDDIDVAKPALINSKALNDLDLLYIILSRDSPFWQAIAKREDLTENVVETLVDTKDVATAKNLVENTNIIFSDYSLGQIVRLANNTDVLNDCLINRSNTFKGEFARKIYEYAGDALKQMIAENCGSLSGEVSRKLDEVLFEFTEPAPSHFLPSPAMVKAAELFAEQGKLTKALMLNTLKRGQMASFIAQFAKFTGLPVAVVIPMLQQKTGQSLAITARAHDLDKTDFLMIFNFTRKIMGEDYLSASDVSSTLAYFSRVSPEVAKRLMKRTKTFN